MNFPAVVDNPLGPFTWRVDDGKPLNVTLTIVDTTVPTRADWLSSTRPDIRKPPELVAFDQKLDARHHVLHWKYFPLETNCLRHCLQIPLSKADGCPLPVGPAQFLTLPMKTTTPRNYLHSEQRVH